MKLCSLKEPRKRSELRKAQENIIYTLFFLLFSLHCFCIFTFPDANFWKKCFWPLLLATHLSFCLCSSLIFRKSEELSGGFMKSQTAWWTTKSGFKMAGRIHLEKYMPRLLRESRVTEQKGEIRNVPTSPPWVATGICCSGT